MKIEQVKDYKKPLYAAGLTVAVVATSLAGCKAPWKPDIVGDETMVTYETSDVELSGEVAIDGGEDIAPTTTAATDELIIDGGETVDPGTTSATDETDELVLDGDVDVCPETQESK
ncbi:hypothetical protein SAMN02910456_00414 [Ruminococcaceae bacterium YRB3002]|nr:hypothetical protein SAMN02910456_00414 [Ruminococcaceae bacterium YRB3002]